MKKTPQFDVYRIACCLIASALLAQPILAQSTTPQPHLFSVPPAGLTQFPVRNGLATDDYLFIEQHIGIGKALPGGFWQHPLADEKGHPYSLEHLRGSTLVLDFWGTTCGPCLRALPHLQEVAKKYRSKDVVILCVCETPSDLAGFQTQAAQFHNSRLQFLMDPMAVGDCWYKEYAFSFGGIVGTMGVREIPRFKHSAFSRARAAGPSIICLRSASVCGSVDVLIAEI